MSPFDSDLDYSQLQCLNLPGIRQSGRLAALTAALAPFTPASARAVLEAASTSPGACHRLPSLLVAWAQVVARPPKGSQVASAEVLPALLAAARAAAPALVWHEEYLPADPRRIAHFAYRGRRYRLHPGVGENVLERLDRVEMWSRVLDPVLRDQFGFGISELLELTLRFSDALIVRLAPSWAMHQLPMLPLMPDAQSSLEQADFIAGLPAAITEEELLAQAELDTTVLLASSVDDCCDSSAATRALRWASIDAKKAARSYRREPGKSLAALALNGAGGKLVPLPVSEWLAGLDQIVARMLQDSGCGDVITDALAEATAIEVRQLLQPWNPQPGPAEDPDSAKGLMPIGVEGAESPSSEDASDDPSRSDAHSLVVVASVSRRCWVYAEILPLIYASTALQELEKASQRVTEVDVMDLREAGAPIGGMRISSGWS